MDAKYKLKWMISLTPHFKFAFDATDMYVACILFVAADCENRELFYLISNQ